MTSTPDIVDSTNELLENVFNELPPDYVDQLKDVKSFRKVFTTNAKIIFKKDFISSLRFNTLTRIPERLYDGKYRSLRSADDVYFNVLLINNLERIGLNRTISMADSNNIIDYLVDHNRVDPFYEYVSSLQQWFFPRYIP